MNIQIQVGAVRGDALVDAYRRQDPSIAGFFGDSPFDPDAFRRKAEEIEARFDATARLAMADAVRPSGAAARHKLDRIAAGHGFFITTGQQPGLFGGPLYSVHKALTAIVLAERLETLLDAPVLALFWVASDDHDWEEANHIHLLDPANDVHRVSLAGDARPPRSMGRRRLEHGAETALSELAQHLPPSDFTPAVLERLSSAYEPESTVASAFMGTMAAVFQDLEIGVVDGQDPVVRRLGARILRRELETPGESEAALREQTQRLESAGYEAQVPILPDASNVFYEDDRHGRERLIREEGGWILRASGERLTDAELWARWAQDESRFSANVVLRPVVESEVFPTLAYVAGPGEIRYLAQTARLFGVHGVGMPLVYPRLGVTLVEGKVAKVMDRFGLDLTAFRRPVHELISAVVRSDVPAEVDASIGRLRASVQAGYEELFGSARGVDPTLKGPIFGARNESLRALSEAEKKIRHHVKLRHETELEQIVKASVNLSPLGKPQERVFNIHQYEARYGPTLVAEMLAAMQDGIDEHLGGVAQEVQAPMGSPPG